MKDKKKSKEQLIVELAESEEKYRTVFENTGTATVILEENAVISMTNTQFEKLSGYSKDEIENKMKWTDFVISEDLERMKKYHIARRKTGEKAPTEYEFRLIDKKGNIKDIFLKIGMIPNTKKSVASLMDISECKQVEEKIKHLNLILRAIRSVNQLIVKEKNRERLVKGACNNLIKTRGYYSALIALLDESGKLETYAEAGIGKALLPIVELLKKGELIFCGQKALKQQEVVTIKDPVSTCPECPLMKQHSGRRAMTIRLEHSGKVYGFVSVSIPAHIADDQEEQSLFKEVAGDIAFSIHNIELDEELQQSYQRLKKTIDAAIETMSKIIEAKDPYTSGHQHRVCQLTVPLAQELGLSEDKIEGIRIASLIHDIGKIGLPTEILSKPSKLTDIEFSLIKGHSQIGYNILKSIDFSYPVAQIVLQHHERLNGSGYPNKLRGDKTLLEAKIIGVADVVEAMSSFRPYRPALGIDAALEEISKNRGILYDPKVVDACIELFKEKGFKFK
jgi:PAS domain S-box-containing protein